MKISVFGRLVQQFLFGVAGIATLLTTGLALANAGGKPTPLDPFVTDIDPGVACDFALRIEGTGGHQKPLTFVDKNGDTVRIQSTGTGSALTFTNLDTGSVLATRSNGSNARLTPNADGSATLELWGHNVVITFPTDNPPGPSTTLYVGRVVISIDNQGNFASLTANGTATDICAALP